MRDVSNYASIHRIAEKEMAKLLLEKETDHVPQYNLSVRPVEQQYCILS